MRPVEVRPSSDYASLEEVQRAMEAAPNKRSYIRLAAIRCLLRGMSRAEVCELFCRSDRMLRLWVRPYNQGGLDALISKPIAGRKRKISLMRLEDLLVPVLKIPSQRPRSTGRASGCMAGSKNSYRWNSSTTP